MFSYATTIGPYATPDAGSTADEYAVLCTDCDASFLTPEKGMAHSITNNHAVFFTGSRPV